MAPTPRKPSSKPPVASQVFAAAEESNEKLANQAIGIRAGMADSIETSTAEAGHLAADPASAEVEILVSAADEIHASVGNAAEQSLEQSRTAYDRLRAAAEHVTGSLETSYTAATKGVNEFNVKAIDALKSNTDATFDLLKALMNVKTLSEAITLQTEHARKQFDALTAQSKELTDIAKKVAAETTEPLKTSVAKTFGKAA
jgi:phasin